MLGVWYTILDIVARLAVVTNVSMYFCYSYLLARNLMVIMKLQINCYTVGIDKNAF